MNDEYEYECNNEECRYQTDDIFDYIDHMGIDIRWVMRISPSYTMEFYAFLKELNRVLMCNDAEEGYFMVQAVTYMLFNASTNPDFEEKMNENYIKANTTDIILGLEKMLKGDKNE